MSRLAARASAGRWTRQSLRDVAYSGAVLAWSVAGFTILVSGAAVTGSLVLFVVGVLVWVGFAYVARWTTWVDRRLAGWQRHEHVRSAYVRPMTPGFVPLVRTLTRDPQTWRDLGWLAITSVVGFVGGLAVVVAAGLAATYLSMPLWYWAVTDPRTEHGITDLGQFTVDTMSEALIVAAVGIVLVPLALLLARRFATAHAALAVRLLSPAPDEAAVPPTRPTSPGGGR